MAYFFGGHPVYTTILVLNRVPRQYSVIPKKLMVCIKAVRQSCTVAHNATLGPATAELSMHSLQGATNDFMKLNMKQIIKKQRPQKSYTEHGREQEHHKTKTRIQENYYYLHKRKQKN